MRIAQWLRRLIIDESGQPETHTLLLGLVSLRRRTRIRFMLIGALITAIGLVFPWYLVFTGDFVYAGKAVKEDIEVVTGLEMLSNARELGDELTANGLKWLLVAVGVTLVNVLFLWLVKVTEEDHRQKWARRITGWVLTGANLLAIYLFIKDQWWANFEGGYQTSIRASSYLDNGATDYALAFARSTFVRPAGGFALTIIGAAVMALGLYPRTRRETEADRQAQAAKRLLPRPGRGGLGWIPVVVVALVCAVCATIYYGQASTWKERWAADAIASAGKPEPVVFTVGGDHGLGILKAGFPSSRAVDCGTGKPTENAKFEPTAATPAGLTFDKAGNRYTYEWKTDPSWASSCRELYLGFTEAVPDVGDAMLVINFWFRN